MERFINPLNVVNRHEGVIELDPYNWRILMNLFNRFVPKVVSHVPTSPITLATSFRGRHIGRYAWVMFG